MPNPPAFITRAPHTLDAWAACFDVAGLPVLAETAVTIEDLREHEDAVDAHMLAEAVSQDPLMTLKLLAHVSALRRRHGHGGPDRSDAETVTAALVLLGITPFFKAFGPQQTIDTFLAEQPAALAGLQRVLRRAHRAARFAIGFAVHRMDHDAPVIHEAALLHDFAEMLLWLHAPALALDIAARQTADAGLRSAAAQREVLHVELTDLHHHLMLAWRLPELLVRITDDHALRETDQLRNVRLAIRLARHSADGWDNPALPDDMADIAALLLLGNEPTERLLRDIDTD